MSTWDPFEPVPEVVGDRYRLGAVLGEGGAAVVYEATDEQTGTAIALKLVRAPALSKPLRFMAEMRDMARIDHPRVVRVLDAGRTGGHYWLAMERMSNGSLQNVVQRDGPLPPFRALELCYQVLQGLHAVHAAQLVHRDVKPHNVLLDDTRSARLTDFGLARHIDGDVPWKTRTGESLGTPTYRAPEQARSPAAAGREADIYGTGALLYFLVTGRKPGFFYLMDPTEFAQATAGLPEPIVRILRKATAHLPEERYRTALEMASACASAADALPDRGSREPVASEWIRWFDQPRAPVRRSLWDRFSTWARSLF
jgi:serine/threonine-protein kinase